MLGHEFCINAILEQIEKYQSFDEVEKTPVVGNLVNREATIPAEELYKLENIDQIRLSLNALIQSYMGTNGEVDYVDYKNFCQQYARSIHASYMMPSDKPANNRWFGYTITGPALGGKTIGRVFPAVDEAGDPVAIKILDQKRYSDELYLSAFRRGIKSHKILEKNRLDGIIPVLDAYEVPPTIVMNFEDCASLKDVVEAKKLSLLDKLSIIESTAKIILSAHMLPEIVLHRDIRPSNILLTNFNWSEETYEQVKVIDFDLSWHKGAMGDDFVRTERDSMGFQAPEQFEGPASANKRTTLIDAYGLGATLFYCLAARNPPLNAAREEGWASDVSRFCNISFREFPEVVQFVTRILTQSMEDKMDQRISVSEIRDRLQDVIFWISDAHEKCSVRFISEMICAMSAYGAYKVDQRQQLFTISTSHGLNMSTSYDFVHDLIVCAFEYRKPGNVQNSRADSVLNKISEEFVGYFSELAVGKPSFRFTGSREFDAHVVFSPSFIKINARRLTTVIRRISQILVLQ